MLWVLVGILIVVGFVIELFENRYKYFGFVNGLKDILRDFFFVFEIINIIFVFVVFVFGFVILSIVMILCYLYVIYYVWFSVEDKVMNVVFFKLCCKLIKFFIIVIMIFIIIWILIYGRLIVKEFVN